MNNSYEIVNNAMIALGYKTKRELAKALNISPSDLNNRTKSGTINELLIDLAVHKNVNINWILTGQGEMMMNYKPAEEKNHHTIMDIQEQYSCQNDNLMEKTAEILQTNSVFKKALDSNIVAFHEAIKLRTDLSVTQAKLKKCQSDLIETQSELHDCKSEIAELRQELNNLKNSLVLKETA
jgi:polyhydroxyalkanoate synthesis regulator phasin